MKRSMKIFSLVMAMVLCTVALLVHAQTDTTGNGGGGGGLTLSPTLIWILGAVLVVYEAVVRLVPTVGNWSILGLLIQLIQGILPNRAKPEATEVKKTPSGTPVEVEKKLP